MVEAPRVEDRPRRPYVAVRRTVAADGFPAAIDDAFPRLFALASAPPAGPPFVRYRGESAAGYDVDLAVPVGVAPAAALPSGFVADALPAGRYVVVIHVGPYEGLESAHAAVDAAGFEQDELSGARVEHYVTDPRSEPDPSRWRVDVEQLLR